MMAEIADQHAHQREHHHGEPLGVDAGEFGRFRIAAGRIDVAAEAGAAGDEGHDDADGERDQHRDGDSRWRR